MTTYVVVHLWREEVKDVFPDDLLATVACQLFHPAVEDGDHFQAIDPGEPFVHGFKEGLQAILVKIQDPSSLCPLIPDFRVATFVRELRDSDEKLIESGVGFVRVEPGFNQDGLERDEEATGRVGRECADLAFADLSSQTCVVVWMCQTFQDEFEITDNR